jgi:ATP-binding cassette subfamily E protein 1
MSLPDKLERIAIVNSDKCKPKKCNFECKKWCPVVKMGKLCIEVTKDSSISKISESLCNGCGLCSKKCPFGAVTIVNLPKGLEKDTIHRYSENSFKLHRLPIPRPGQVLGLVGSNGTGKSTALKILAGKIKPNFGNFNKSMIDKEIVSQFKGNELHTYFTKLYFENLKISMKPQYVDQIPKYINNKVSDILYSLPDYKNNINEHKKYIDQLILDLELINILDRNISELSGGELQRFSIAYTCAKDADVYIFDEPSSFLDIKQRINVAKTIRSILLRKHNVYIIVVEHDLSVLDYLSDFICCLYGEPSAYGVVTMPFGVRDGINIFLSGFIPTENMRFRAFSLTFKISDQHELDENIDKNDHHLYKYPKMIKFNNDFKLQVESGSFTDSEIIVMLGQNGCGKTTFVKLLAGMINVDNILSDDIPEIPNLCVSYKPQTISPKFSGTVRELFYKKIKESYLHSQFNTDVLKPLRIDDIIDNNVLELSGGELQRVALVLCLGQPADIYLIDEPSAYLDSEQRIITSKVIKRFIMHAKKTAFIVEHDFIMATYLADKVIVYSGTPSIDCIANCPQQLLPGMNNFLKQLDVTFRRDPTNYRPRINKLDSIKDKEQKQSGNFFTIDNNE